MTDAPDKATGILQIGESEWQFCETVETIKSMEFSAGDEYIHKFTLSDIAWNAALEAAAKIAEEAWRDGFPIAEIPRIIRAQKYRALSAP